MVRSLLGAMVRCDGKMPWWASLFGAIAACWPLLGAIAGCTTLVRCHGGCHVVRCHCWVLLLQEAGSGYDTL